MSKNEKHHKLSRSVRIKKYESVYDSYIKSGFGVVESNETKSEKRERKERKQDRERTEKPKKEKPKDKAKTRPLIPQTIHRVNILNVKPKFSAE